MSLRLSTGDLIDIYVSIAHDLGAPHAEVPQGRKNALRDLGAHISDEIVAKGGVRLNPLPG